MSKLLKTLTVATVFAASMNSYASPMLTAGKLVNKADRSLTFSGITHGTNLSTYQESNVLVTVNDDAFVSFSPFGAPTTGGFHYGSGGNESFVSVRGTDNAVFSEIDFLLGNGWSASSALLRYETFLGGQLTGAAVNMVATGIVKITDDRGFDEIRLGATVGPTTYNSFGDFQAIALDNMHLSVSAKGNVANKVPEPGSVALLGLALAGLIAARRKKTG